MESGGGRRGSGVSITLPVRPSNTGGMDKSFGMNYPPMPGYAAPYYVQSPPYPMLMNPPHIPTVIVQHPFEVELLTIHFHFKLKRV
jgi:hypothetical protein